MKTRNLTLMTDLYELTMMQGYFKENNNETVVFDIFYRNNPCGSGYAIAAGLEQIIDYIQNLQFTYGEYSEAMARLVQKHYVKSGRHNRGVKRQPLKVLYATDMPGILTEIVFLSNSEEYAYMNSEKGQAQIARALSDAVKDYVAFVRGTLLVDADAIYEQADADVAEPTPAADTASGKADKGSVNTGKAKQEKTFYAVQLIASAKRVPLKDRQFKSYRGKVVEFVTGGRFRYKYCVVHFETRKQAETKLAEVRREFRDAFVVRCQGDRIVQ